MLEEREREEGETNSSSNVSFDGIMCVGGFWLFIYIHLEVSKEEKVLIINNSL